MAISKVQQYKQRAKAFETREKQERQRQQEEKDQLRTLGEIEAEKTKSQQNIRRALRRLEELKRAALNRRRDAWYEARDIKRLESYNAFAEQYNRNLEDEGFALLEGLWQKQVPSDTKPLRKIQFHQLKPLSSASGIPKKLGHSPIYKRERWEDIQATCLWYMDRNADYERLGFIKASCTTHKRHRLPYDGIMSFFASGDPCEVWTWPGARDGDALPCEQDPEDGASYESRVITDMDELILTRKGWRFVGDQKNLPSAQLGHWQDHWHRGMRDTDLEAEYTSTVAAEYLRYTIRPKKDKKVRKHHNTRHLTSVYCPWTLANRQPRTWKQIKMQDWHKHLCTRLHFGMQLCYDRRMFRRVLENSDWILRLARRRHTWFSNRKRFSFWSQQIHHVEKKVHSECTTFEVPGYVNGRNEVAFPDSGSDYNLVSKDFISRNQTPYVKQQLEIQLPNGNTAMTEGSVYLEWSFEDAPGEAHKIQFHILRNCVHDLLLGNPFLELTQLNTTNQHRIKQRVVKELSAGDSPVYDCHLVHNTKQGIRNRMHGGLNGHRVAVIPDSGCRVNAMSLTLARALGKEIRYSGERGTFRFIDGSTAPSLGVVKMPWRPDHSNEEYILEFEIMKDCNGIILGQKFLYGNRAFVKHAACLTNYPSNAPEAMDSDDSSSETSHSPSLSVDKPPDHVDTQAMMLEIFEIDDEKGKVYEVSWLESPWRRLRRRLRGGSSHAVGPRSGIQHEAQYEMEWRATVENEILRMRRGEARTRAVLAELRRRRAMSDDDRGNEFLIGLLPRKGTSPQSSSSEEASN